MHVSRRGYGNAWSVSRKTYQVERREQLQASEAHGQGDQHNSVEIQRLESPIDAAPAILIVGKLLRVLIGEDGIFDHLELVVRGNEPGEVHALRPRTVMLADRLQVVHVENFSRYLPQAHGGDVQASARPSSLDSGLNDLDLSLAIPPLAEGVWGQTKIERGIRGDLGGLRLVAGQRSGCRHLT